MPRVEVVVDTTMPRVIQITRFLLVFSFLLGVAGLAFGQGQAPRFRITVDTICYKWNVCVYDSGSSGGVKGLALLDNLANVSFEASLDSMNTKIVNLQPPRRDICFTVRVDNQKKDAYAPLYIIDSKGNGTLVPLKFNAESPFTPPYPGKLLLQPYDSSRLQHVPTYIDEEICKEFALINKSPGLRSYKLDEISLQAPYRLTKVSKPIGTVIYPGDTLKIGICFSAGDTIAYHDSLYLTMGCHVFAVPVFGQAGTGLIVASDKNFGTTSGGIKKCYEVGVKNSGNKPFTLDKNWAMIEDDNFYLDTTDSRNQFPVTLTPGKTHRFSICYLPRTSGEHTSWILWSTDIRPPFRNQLKPFSDFTGTGIVPSVTWDRGYQKLELTTDLDTVQRVHLINDGPILAELSRIWIDGPDADEFSVVATEPDNNPPTWHGTTISKGSHIWVDIEFKANLMKASGSLRRAYLRASTTFDTVNNTWITLDGDLGAATVKKEPTLKFSMHPNPTQSNVVLDLNLEEARDVSVSIYDVLGREVAGEMFGGRAPGVHSLELTLSHLEEGAYYVRVAAGEAVRTLPLEIRR